MVDNSSSNKLIAKNAVMLYLRMFLVLAVSLYTSRVVLKTLGISDFGVYNIVGGFVSMLAYLNSVLVGSSQRFISYSLGKKDSETLNKTFVTTQQIHLILSLVILFVAESFGLWFVNSKLVIDPDRIVAANWVYQCSLISLFLTINSIPYSACIVAHENMHVYAYVSVLEVVLKLVILYLLLLIPGDKLIVYAILHIAISLTTWIIYRLYCRRHFYESKSDAKFDKSLFKEMFSFAGWSAIGSLGFSFKDQFSNIILNGFFGTTINAARGLAMQVNSAIISFSDNFFTAIKPQIVKQYAAGNIERSQKLVYTGARFSFYLLSLITIPVILNVDYILQLWLEVVPEYTSQFLIITLLSSLIYSLTTSTSTAIQATGKIKAFQIGVTCIMLLELPIAYVILKAGCNPYWAVIPVIFTSFLALLYRFYILKRLVPTYSLRHYYVNTVLRCVLVFVLSLIASFVTRVLFTDNFWGVVLNVVASIIITGSFIIVLGINKKERQALIQFLHSSFIH